MIDCKYLSQTRIKFSAQAFWGSLPRGLRQALTVALLAFVANEFRKGLESLEDVCKLSVLGWWVNKCISHDKPRTI